MNLDLTNIITKFAAEFAGFEWNIEQDLIKNEIVFTLYNDDGTISERVSSLEFKGMTPLESNFVVYYIFLNLKDRLIELDSIILLEEVAANEIS